VLKLPEAHPLKKWMKSIASVKPLSMENQKKNSFMKEIINSQFNLITDPKVKTEIIELIGEISENTLPEQILKSYLYLMIGNVARSDNILREIITTPPRVNWEKSFKVGGPYHEIAKGEIKQLFHKLGRHPADRKSFQLLCLYLKVYYNETSLIALAEEIDTNEVETKADLKIIETIASSLVHFYRLSGMNDEKRFKALRGSRYPLPEQSYWFWPFLDIDPLVSEKMIPELNRLETEDQLWFIYLLGDEKLADLVSKKSGKSFLPARRPFLKEGLYDNRSFMMSLYKIIEIGDVNSELVSRTTQYLINE
jgi:hypothetical protein